MFDTVGGDVVRSYKVLKPGGRLVWIAAAPEGFQAPRDEVQIASARRARPGASRAHDGIARCRRRAPPAITRYKLADAAEAHGVSEGRHLQGKLVLDVR